MEDDEFLKQVLSLTHTHKSPTFTVQKVVLRFLRDELTRTSLDPIEPWVLQQDEEQRQLCILISQVQQRTPKQDQDNAFASCYQSRKENPNDRRVA